MIMKVKCIICDSIVNLDSKSKEAKRLRNHPIHTFMCDDCKERLDKPKSEYK
ncbi:DUF2197 domain-containing protein [Mammaliicoccus sciuri]|uniref:DUF2197 domain-containing protein n=1 Tax=Mammaliicoccus sciuri TaxID=1296 RepID=UPI00374E0C9C